MRLLADTHVHLHPCFDPEAFFDAAVRNFDRAAPGGASGETLGLLCLTDSEGMRTETLLCESVRQAGAWRFSCDADRGGVRAERADGRRIHLLPGRQIVSRENLEWLALDCRGTADDRTLDSDQLIHAIRDWGGIPVLPWGFGKWTGGRGRIVRRLLDTRRDFHLADNGNRLRGTPLPRLLREGQRRGFAVLAGSDPLPLASQARRAGSCGIAATLPAEALSPSAAFRAILDQPDSWTCYGELASPLEFFINQLRMQIRKRMGKRS